MAIQARLRVRDVDDPVVRAALARLAPEDRVPHAAPEQEYLWMHQVARNLARLQGREIRLASWTVEDVAAYHAALSRCVTGAGHDPEEVVRAWRAALDLVAESYWGRPDPARDLAESYSGPPDPFRQAQYEYWCLSSAVERAAPMVLLRFRLRTEALRCLARREGETRVQFREHLQRLTSVETHGRPPGREYSPTILAVFVEELTGLPALQTPLPTTDWGSQAERAERLGALPAAIEALEAPIEQALDPLTASWHRFTPHWFLFVPDDVPPEFNRRYDQGNAFEHLTEFPLPDAHAAVRAALRQVVEDSTRRRSRSAPGRLAETITAELFTMSGVPMTAEAVHKVRAQADPQRCERCRAARRAWSGEPTAG
jgi:hypothetical protein